MSKLSEVQKGYVYKIVCILKSAPKRRLSELGLVKGRCIRKIKSAPLADPVEYELLGNRLSLRDSLSANIYVERA